MSGEVEVEVCRRVRPLSAGLWTLFSWLRRDSSSDSVSSAGSDRTVASFAFLPPGRYAAAAPLPLPPPPPPTDSYRKRVRDRNQRRKHDRDITIHRKYGLYGYDAFSLPSSRRAGAEAARSLDRAERDRRATSESLPRRPHVPGKRRAPPPPASSLTGRRARKRPAPQPPVQTLQKPNQTISTVTVNSDEKAAVPMSTQPPREKPLAQNSEINLGCKPEKYSKKDAQPKETKIRQEKSFLKQIFENKKRHSTVETSSLKLLPNISELDKQAAELIEKYKLKELDKTGSEKEAVPGSSQQVDSWICTRCFKKYNATVVTCLYCLPLPKTYKTDAGKSHNSTQTIENKNISRGNDHEDKEKLKEMLKEIKNSLPKKQNNISVVDKKTKETKPKENVKIIEAPTLRIGSSSHEKSETKVPKTNKCLTQHSNIKLTSVPNDDAVPLATINNVIISQPVVLEHTPKNIIKIDDINKNKVLKANGSVHNKITKNENQVQRSEVNTRLNTPLKISSLLNPIYVPKHNDCSGLKPNITPSILPISTSNISTVATSSTSTTTTTSNIDELSKSNKNNVEKNIESNSLDMEKPSSSKSIIEVPNKNEGPNTILLKFDQHSKRRELINQLEKSIAKGDEKAAAEAAVKLAQLKLSCSVLSFSSQIMSEPSTSQATANVSANKNVSLPNNTNKDKPSEDKKVIQGSKVSDKKSIACNTENLKPQQPVASTSKELRVDKNDTNVIKGGQGSVLSSSNQNDGDIAILIWIEDKEATRGPVQLYVRRNAKLGDLRTQTERSLGLPSRMQRWIIGRNLCADDSSNLVTLAGPDLSAPFYLCLVETDSKSAPKLKIGQTPNKEAGEVYNELMKLEQQPLVANAETFECGVCMEECIAGNGVVLRECVHSFCRECLSDVVRHSEEPAVSCPATACRGVLQEREIRGLVTPEDYEKWLARGLAVAESGTRNAFHCRTRDCTGWALCDPGVRTFPCPVCKHNNCIPCQAIHEGRTCEQHRTEQQKTESGNEDAQTDDSTRAFLNTLISRGEALECPECSAIITKKWGCDWIKCSACKTEICWVTRGRRWGPGGRGDTSAGCRCGVDGKKCHPTCGYCH